ncbi:DNA mismatch repair protein MutS [Kordia sp.]|uniref:MutS-related protein n=1 Tax=Kordia sp. TaxID=1965332 RepID=UPI0025BFC0E5|nr:DNA mismatch repair protein MutS [Kordia sp.]MCH2196108.1 DNA mismatch repair protein MutS [Kordia sp.]
MIKTILYQIRHAFSSLFSNRKKAVHKRLKTSFGKEKDEDFNFSMIEKYFLHKEHSTAHQVISDKTCNDLDFDELFMFLDRTHSKVGQQYLYNQLRVIQPNDPKRTLNEEIISEVSANETKRIAIQQILEKLNHKDAYYIRALFQEPHILPPKWFSGIKILSFLSVISVILSFYKPIFFGIFLVIFCINLIIHYWNKKNLVQYINSIPQLIRLNVVAAHLFTYKNLQKLDAKLPDAIQVIRKVKNRMSFFQLEANLQGEFAILAWFVFEIIKITFLIEPLFLFGVLRKLDTKRNEIESVFTFVGHVDMLISIASVRKSEAYCIPKIYTKTEIEISEIRHPLIYDCVTNTLHLQKKSLLLTGSNMSGKTSFIRAVGINVITGLTLNTCFAKSMSFPIMRIYSAIRISDDLMNDKSYYFEEVTTIKEMIQESQKNGVNLFLLDELFKGTNTVERISAGKAVLSALAKNNNKVLVSTHDIELTDMLFDSYVLYHFGEIINSNKVAFDYKLKEGKLKNRNAIKILEMNKYPEEVIQEAMDISKKLDASYQNKKKTN